MRRILICSTILETVKAFLIPHIKLLQGMGYSVDVAGNKEATDLDAIVDNIYDIPFQRNPFLKQNIIASRQLKEIVCTNHYDIIHFHTPVASAFGRWTVKGIRNSGTKVIYTAHGFHFFKGAPLKNWMIFYPVERWLARYTDVLITINKEDYTRAKKSLKAGVVEYVPGVGIDTKKFSEVVIDKSAKRKELGLPNDAFVVLSVGELNKNKNHETVIKAIAKLNNPNVYYIICGQGVLEVYLKDLIKKLGLEKQVKLLGNRTDIAEINKASDVFAFPSLREGLSVALMESMTIGLPVICSNIRGNIDLIEEGKGGFLINAKYIDGFANRINVVLENATLKQNMGERNKKEIIKFGINTVINDMEKIYSD